jgi:hypothetical protein
MTFETTFGRHSTSGRNRPLRSKFVKSYDDDIFLEIETVFDPGILNPNTKALFKQNSVVFYT